MPMDLSFTIKPPFMHRIKSSPDSRVESRGTPSIGQLLSFATANRYAPLASAAAFTYYDKIAPLSKAVNLIADNFKIVTPSFLDLHTRRYLKDEEVPSGKFRDLLTLLADPSLNGTGISFRVPCSIADTVTGNVYIQVLGVNATSRATELHYLEPQNVSPQENAAGDVELYRYQRGSVSKVFQRTEIKTGVYAYLADGGISELIHIKRFNPNSRSVGRSPLNSLVYELTQFENSHIHNNALLANGGTVSMAILLHESLTAEQCIEFDNFVQDKIKGVDNAGRVLVMGGSKDIKNLGQSNKDMDFAELKKQVRTQIYDSMNIPFPLVESATMTYDNYMHSIAVLYNLAVLPAANAFYSQMQQYLFRRYGVDETKYQLCVDPSKIPSLVDQTTALALKKISTNLLTPNEGREILGYGAVADGGDDLYFNGALMNLTNPTGNNAMNPDKEPKAGGGMGKTVADVIAKWLTPKAGK